MFACALLKSCAGSGPLGTRDVCVRLCELVQCQRLFYRSLGDSSLGLWCLLKGRLCVMNSSEQSMVRMQVSDGGTYNNNVQWALHAPLLKGFMWGHLEFVIFYL